MRRFAKRSGAMPLPITAVLIHALPLLRDAIPGHAFVPRLSSYPCVAMPLLCSSLLFSSMQCLCEAYFATPRLAVADRCLAVPCLCYALLICAVAVRLMAYHRLAAAVQGSAILRGSKPCRCCARLCGSMRFGSMPLLSYPYCAVAVRCKPSSAWLCHCCAVQCSSEPSRCGAMQINA